MISQTDILIEGDTAWLVVPDPLTDVRSFNEVIGSQYELLKEARPCDTCGGVPPCGHGFKIAHARDIKCGTEFPCPDCIDGRHTFDIEVESALHVAWERADRWYNHDHTTHCERRVSVVEVLPIRDGALGGTDDGTAHIRDDGPGYLPMNRWVAMPARGMGEYVRLPESAAPGMWAVKLAVHKEKT